MVDPIDGTANFVEGDESFAVMVGLLRDGVTVIGWILAPVSGDLSVAETGRGATLNGQPFAISRADPDDPIPGMAATRRLPPELAAAWEDRGISNHFRRGSGVSGIEYPALVAGYWSSLFFWRTRPWDHVAGCLLVEEAGGHVARLDGSAYAPGDGRNGLLVASSEREWSRTRALMPRHVPDS